MRPNIRTKELPIRSVIDASSGVEFCAPAAIQLEIQTHPLDSVRQRATAQPDAESPVNTHSSCNQNDS
jgi:hypothetical protein